MRKTPPVEVTETIVGQLDHCGDVLRLLVDVPAIGAENGDLIVYVHSEPRVLGRAIPLTPDGYRALRQLDWRRHVVALYTAWDDAPGTYLPRFLRDGRHWGTSAKHFRSCVWLVKPHRRSVFSVEASTIDGVLFELLSQVGCRMRPQRRRRH